jgi:glycosyltransferase involved in cell wall biosynthesis
MYNQESFIECALRSVFAQTVPPDEIIVVDDGSTDEGPRLVQNLEGPQPLTLLRKANGGQSSARNLGIAHARSELVAFLDGDDVWYPTHLEELLRCFEQAPHLGWAYSDLDEIDERGNITRRGLLNQERSKHPKDNLRECLRTNMEVHPSATLVRRKAIIEVGGFDESLRGYEDDDLFLRIFQIGYSSAYVANATCQYRHHRAQTTRSTRIEQSRRLYAAKLFATYPQHAALVAKKFLAPMRQQIYRALRERDDALARDLLQHTLLLVGKLPMHERIPALMALSARILRGYFHRLTH